MLRGADTGDEDHAATADFPVGLCMIRCKSASSGFEDLGMTCGNTDAVIYPESEGAPGHRATSAEAMPALLQQRLDSPGVHVVEMPIVYADNDRILNEDVRELSATLPV